MSGNQPPISIHDDQMWMGFGGEGRTRAGLQKGGEGPQCEVAPGRTPREQGRFIAIGAQSQQTGQGGKDIFPEGKAVGGDGWRCVKERRLNGGFASQE